MSNDLVNIVDLINVLNQKIDEVEWYILHDDAKASIFADISNTNSLYQVYYTTSDDKELIFSSNSKSDYVSQDIIFIGKVGVKYYYDEDSYEERREFFIAFVSKVNGVLKTSEKVTYYHKVLDDEKYIDENTLLDLFEKVQIKVSDLDGKIKNWFTKLK